VGFRGTGVQQPSDEAFRFTVGSGVIGLGHLPGGALSLSYAYGVSADGSVVVGRSNSQVGDQAFVWTPQTGMLALSDILIASGIDPAQDGWTVLTQASAVTPDGRFVAGFGDRNGHREGFLADLVAIPEPSSFLLLSLGSVLLCGRFKSRLAASQRQNVP
jgi:probable HAF family extracellular repeat protein